MKIDNVIMSSDDNPLYLDFWPIVSKIWEKRFHINPVLIYFGNKKNISGTVIYHPPIKNLPLDIQTLWSRYFYTSWFPNQINMVSDIDMIPISKNYFMDKLLQHDESSYIHINTNEGRPMLSSCYHIAHEKTFKSFLELPPIFEESLKDLMSFGYKQYEDTKSYWYVDEMYATFKLKNKPVTYLIRDTANRLDRSNWKYSKEDLELGKFIDCHCLRPYSKYKQQIDELINCLI